MDASNRGVREGSQLVRERDAGKLLKSATILRYRAEPYMIELNPIRQRIADLVGRLDALRGFL